MKSTIKTVITILIFLALEYISLNMYFSSDVSTYAKNINAISYINLRLSNVSSYFGLQSTVENLTEDITSLEAELKRKDKIIELYKIASIGVPDSTIGYDFAITGKVIYQNIVMSDNLIKIDKGEIDGVKKNMTVVKNNSVVGYVLEVEENHCVVRSIMSKKIRTSGALKKNNSFCSINWDGQDIHSLCFTELTKYSDAQVGDTIITTPFSNLFTQNLNIGVITDLELVQGMYYNGKIEMFSNFKQLDFLTIIATTTTDSLTISEPNMEDYE